MSDKMATSQAVPGPGSPLAAVEVTPSRGLAYVIVWTFLCSIFIIWVMALLVASGLLARFELFPELSSMERALAVFAIGLTICCGILWVGHVTSAVILREKTGGRIWATLIVVVLASSAAAITGVLEAKAPAGGVSINDMMLIDETRLMDEPQGLVQRRHQIFIGETSTIGFLFTASGFGTTPEDRADLLISIILLNPSTGVAEVQELHKRVKPDDWKKSALGGAVLKLVPDSTDRFASAVMLADRKPIGTGKLQLILRVIDMSNKMVDTRSIELDIRPGSESRSMGGQS